MEKFKLTPHLECLGADPDNLDYVLYSFTVKAEINGKNYTAQTAEISINKWLGGITLNDCPRYIYIGENVDWCWICTYLTNGGTLESDWLRCQLRLFGQGLVTDNNAYIVEIATGEIIAEYHDSKNSRSIIIRNKEKCYLD